MVVQDWWSGGELVPLELSGTEQGVFVRREGSGPSMTLLHGFPSSSHDWAKLAPALAERYALVLVAAKRARQINNYHHQLGEGIGFDEAPPPLIESRSKNYLTMAMEEIASGKIKHVTPSS